MPRAPIHVLAVDDDEPSRGIVVAFLEALGYRAEAVASGPAALERLARPPQPDVVLLDVLMQEMDGIETLRRYRAAGGTVPVVMMSALDEADTVIQAMRLGANDYVTKPLQPNELREILDRVVDLKPMRAGTSTSMLSADEARAGRVRLGVSPAMRRVEALIDRVADADVPILITGESGVGKDVVAREIHARSARRDRVFVKINCAALPESLLESELFGYERGAFTGAQRSKPGQFELADGGTLFLDEIGEMPAPLQAKLLQALQDGEFYRVGGQKKVRVDVRIIVATNRDLERAIREQAFREDLYYRLNVVQVRIPPLRERREDIPNLLAHFVEKYGRRYGRTAQDLPPEVLPRFLAYDWPGNVRELENLVRRLMVLRDPSYVYAEMRPSPGTPLGAAAAPGPTSTGALERDVSPEARAHPLERTGPIAVSPPTGHPPSPGPLAPLAPTGPAAAAGEFLAAGPVAPPGGLSAAGPFAPAATTPAAGPFAPAATTPAAGPFAPMATTPAAGPFAPAATAPAGPLPPAASAPTSGMVASAATAPAAGPFASAAMAGAPASGAPPISVAPAACIPRDLPHSPTDTRYAPTAAPGPYRGERVPGAGYASLPPRGGSYPFGGYASDDAATPLGEVVAAEFAQAGQDGRVDLKALGRKAAEIAEREAIIAMLARTGGSKREAADRLGISYKAILYKIREYGIGRPRVPRKRPGAPPATSAPTATLHAAQQDNESDEASFGPDDSPISDEDSLGVDPRSLDIDRHSHGVAPPSLGDEEESLSPDGEPPAEGDGLASSALLKGP